MQSRAVGIDLGTTYSVLAYLDSTGRPTTLRNAEGDLLTPSALLFDGDDVIVGREAIKALATEAEFVAQCPKRYLGQRQFPTPLGDELFPPEVLEAWILRKLCQDAQPLLGQIESAVVTVPAYFDEVRRKATYDAGWIAGLNVLDIINEPTAAALAFGYQQGFLDAAGEAHTPQRVLVYDLGGGTFDVTIVEIRGRDFVTLATDGDAELGGHDWDERLVEFAAGEFMRAHDLDPLLDANARGRLWRACEEAKRTLSARPRTTLAFDYRGHSWQTEISTDDFLNLTADLVDRTRFTVRQALRAAGLDWGRIDRVLLVGGSTRMPMVRQLLREMSARDPDVSVAADEAVAYGAALHAGRLQAESSGQPAPFRVSNVNSHSLGVIARDPVSRQQRNACVIPRNTALPVTARRRFLTHKEDQRSILVEVVEGENPSPDACSSVGRCVVRNLPQNFPAKSPVDVLFQYQSDGRLVVAVDVVGVDAELEVEFVRRNSLSRGELFRWRSRVCATPDAPPM